jgi:hypothetical protein
MAYLTFNRTRFMQAIWAKVCDVVKNITPGFLLGVLFVSILFTPLLTPPIGDLVEMTGGWGFPRPVYVIEWTYSSGDSSYFQWSSLPFDLFFWIVFFSLAGLAVKAAARKIGFRIRPLYIFCVVGGLAGGLYVFAIRPVRIINAETGGYLSCFESRNEQIDMAMQYGDIETLQSIFKKHPELVFNEDGFGRTPLHKAALWGHVEIVRLLLADKADVGIRDMYGETPLFDSAIDGYAGAAELLLKNGTEVNVKNGNGETPLFKASAYGRFSEAKLLLENGAKVNVKNNQGDTPHDIAVLNGRTNIVELLRQYGATNN